MGYDSNKGTSDFAAVLNNRMREMIDKLPMTMDTGVIQDDYSLKLNNYEKPIPRGEYSLCRQLTLGGTDMYLTSTVPAGHPGDGTHSHGSSGSHAHGGGQHRHCVEDDSSGREMYTRSGEGSHTHSGDGQHSHTNEGPHIHSVLVPESMRSVMSGDRVLVAWVLNEAIVIDIIVKS